MAYDGTIPALGNLISNDIPAIQENFSLLESAQVVDEGTTADGDYIRYDNGWQICIQPTGISATADVSQSSGVYISGPVVWNYPVTFISFPIALAHSVGNKYSAATELIGTDLSRFNLVSWDGTGTQDVFFFAIGRWK